MLRITIEKVPLGDEDQKELLGIMKVTNDGTGDELNGNYDITLNDGSERRHARIETFPRRWGWFALVRSAFMHAGLIDFREN